MRWVPSLQISRKTTTNVVLLPRNRVSSPLIFLMSLSKFKNRPEIRFSGSEHAKYFFFAKHSRKLRAAVTLLIGYINTYDLGVIYVKYERHNYFQFLIWDCRKKNMASQTRIFDEHLFPQLFSRFVRETCKEYAPQVSTVARCQVPPNQILNVWYFSL